MNEARLFTFLLESNFDEFKIAIENEVIPLDYRFEGSGSELIFINELSKEKMRLLLEAGSKINSKVRSRTAFDFIHLIEEFALLMQYDQKEVKSFLKGQYEMEPYLYYDISIIDYMFESKILNKEILNKSYYHGLAS